MLKTFIHQLLKFFYPLVKKLMPYQVYSYLAVGAANTMLNIGLFIILYLALLHTAFAVELATATSFIITVITGFWLNKNFAFTQPDTEKKQTRKQLSKYFLVSLQGQFCDYLVTKALVLLLLLHPNLAYIISTFVILTINYFLQKNFTFKKISIK